MSDLKKAIAALSPERRALLDAMLKARAAESRAFDSIPRRGGGGPPPLSFAQQRLWFLDQLNPGNPFYNEPLLIFRLRGGLKQEALRRALDEVVRRHEGLRTTFPSSEGRPVQLIHPPSLVPVAARDLGGYAPDEREAELSRVVAREMVRSFDLGRGPLMHVSLLRMGEREHVFILAWHHIITDGWSNRVFMRELMQLYAAYATGAPSPLEELPIQYADFAVWQRRQLGGEGLAPSMAYWKRQLGGELPRLELPTDFPRPPVQTFKGAVHHRVLPAALAGALKELSRREGVTLFMTLLAVFLTLLRRHTGQDDIVVGAPIANRNRREIENLIGFFVNTLVLRTDVSGNPTFRELLGRVRKVATEAYVHQDVPFEKLVEELQPERDLSRQALFQVMFVFHNYPEETVALPGLDVSPAGAADPLALSVTDMDYTGSESKFDFALALSDLKEQGLDARIEYSTDLFKPATVARLMDRFAALLRAAGDAPDTRLNALSMFADDGRAEPAEGASGDDLFRRKLKGVRRSPVTLTRD